MLNFYLKMPLMLSVNFCPKAPMLCVKLLPKKPPLRLSVKLYRKGHHVMCSIFTQKAPPPMLGFKLLLKKTPPCYAFNLYLKRPPCYALHFHLKRPPPC